VIGVIGETRAVRRLLVGAQAAALLLLGTVSPSHAQSRHSDVTCSDQIIQGVFRNVTVSPGHWCLVQHSLVTGSVTSVRASTFGLITSTVLGSVAVTHTTLHPNKAAFFGLGTANGICSSTIRGDLTITDSGPDAPWDVSSTNYPTLGNFSTCVSQISVGGNLDFLRNHSAANQVAGAVVGGSLTCLGNRGFVGGKILPAYPNKVARTASGQCEHNSVGAHNTTKIVPGVPHFTTIVDRGDRVPSQTQWLQLVAQNYRIDPQ